MYRDQHLRMTITNLLVDNYSFNGGMSAKAKFGYSGAGGADCALKVNK